MSLLSRVLNIFRNPLRYVGRDLEGNRFYEHPSISDDPRRTKRTVQYRKPEDVWNYIGGGKRLSVQWSMWLSHTRKHPPTIEELQQDVERQRRVLANVAIIEARDEEERQVRLRLEQSIKDETAKRAQISKPSPKSDTSQPTPVHEDSEISGPSKEASSNPAGEAEAWSPKTLRR